MWSRLVAILIGGSFCLSSCCTAKQTEPCLQSFRCNVNTPEVCSATDGTYTYYNVDARGATVWPTDGFCRVVAGDNTGPSDYWLDVDLYNVEANGNPNTGHPGVMFNLQESNSFDYMFFRPQSPSRCYDRGHIENGVNYHSRTAACPSGPPAGATWFHVQVRMTGSIAQLYLNSELVVTFRANSSAIGRGGVMVANGFKNLVRFANYMIREVPHNCTDFTFGASNNSLTADLPHWPADGFCRVIAGGSGCPTSCYTMSVELYNQGTNTGHPGVMYNVQNKDNYDVVFFRVHSVSTCYQTGYVVNGVFTKVRTGTCPSGPPGGLTWFTVSVTVSSAGADIQLNGQSVLTNKPHFPVARRGGALAPNGFNNVIRYRNFQLS